MHHTRTLHSTLHTHPDPLSPPSHNDARLLIIQFQVFLGHLNTCYKYSKYKAKVDSYEGKWSTGQ